MEIKELKILLQRYFSGETSAEEEKSLANYFTNGDVAAELQEYTGLFAGLDELVSQSKEAGFGDEIMDYIIEHENSEKNRYRSLWKTVTGVAAAVILALGSLLIYEQQRNSFDDTFTNQADAYAYAQKTLQFVEAKYNTGVKQLSKTKKYNETIAELRKFGAVNQGQKPLAIGLNAVNKGFNEIKNIEGKIK